MAVRLWAASGIRSYMLELKLRVDGFLNTWFRKLLDPQFQ